MSKKRERWDCIFADRIEPDGRIYLTSPQQYGFMYTSGNLEVETPKVRKSIPGECGPIKGSSNKDKLMIAIAISTAFNKKRLGGSSGLVLRGFTGGTPFATPETWIVNSPGTGLRVKGTTGWIAYVSPDMKFHMVVNDRYKDNELPDQQTRTIHGCVECMLSEWR